MNGERMMPNIDPRAMKNMMAKLGITTEEIAANRVVIACSDRQIVIDNPQVTQIRAQGQTSFQISGSVKELRSDVHVEINEEDVKMVMEKSGVSDSGKARAALEATDGDIAEAILKLAGKG